MSLDRTVDVIHFAVHVFTLTSVAALIVYVLRK